MNGAEVYTFTLRTIPAALDELLLRAGKSMEDVDFFIFHQANRYMLENLRRKVKIPEGSLLHGYDILWEHSIVNNTYRA